MASAGARAYNGGLRVEPAGSRGTAPGQGSGGKAPLKLKAFSLFGIQWNGKTFAISVFCSFCVQWDFYETAL